MSQARQRVTLASEALARGDLGRAAELAGDLPDDASPRERAELLRVRAQLAMGGYAGDFGGFLELAAAAESVAAGEPLLAARTITEAALIALYRNDPVVSSRLLDRAAELARGDEATERYVAVVAGIALTFHGEHELALEQLRHAMEPLGGASSLVDVVHALQAAVLAFAAMERYDLATEVAERAVTAARRTAAVGILPLTLCLLANSAYFVGDYDAVLLAAAEAEDLVRGSDQAATVVMATVCSALAQAVRGHADEVTRHAATARLHLPDSGLEPFEATVLVAEGILALGLDDEERIRDVYGRIETINAVTPLPTGVLQWRADYVEALHRMGRHADAQCVLEEGLAALGDNPLAWSQAVLSRCRGLLADEGWERHLSAAIDAHPAWLSRFERGRTHLVWAQRAFAEKRFKLAREQAALAVDDFGAVAAMPWLRRADTVSTAAARADQERAVHERQDEPATTALLRVFGPLTITRDNVDTLVPADNPGLLLRYLVVRDGRAHVDEVVEVLWPDAAAGAGATRLRNVLSRLRRQWGDLVVREGQQLRWAPGVAVDLAAFEAEAATALATRDAEVARRAVERFRGDLLPAVRYFDWSAAKRERTNTTLVRLLRLLADDAASAGAVDDAVAYLERAIDIDRYDEAHYVAVADVLLDARRPGAARRFLDRAVAVADELGVEPAEETRRLLERLSMSG